MTPAGATSLGKMSPPFEARQSDLCSLAVVPTCSPTPSFCARICRSVLFVAKDDAAPFAHRTGVRKGLDEPFAHPLAGHLHQSEL